MKQKSLLEKYANQINENEIYSLMEELFPICRSITGNGVRKSLKILKKKINLKIFEVNTGTKVFDWKVPNEWNINDGYVKNKSGKRIIDFKKSNIHVMSYSIPIDKEMTFDDLDNNLYYIESMQDAIPYTTSYYNYHTNHHAVHYHKKNIYMHYLKNLTLFHM